MINPVKCKITGSNMHLRFDRGMLKLWPQAGKKPLTLLVPEYMIITKAKPIISSSHG
jgi:hypothetical protein